MTKVQYKADKGVLHIGDGRFFNAQTPVEVQDKDVLLQRFSDLVDAGEDSDTSGQTPGNDESDESEEHTESSLKKLNAEQQKELIAELGGNVEETNNEDDRIELILQLQEENQEQDKE